MPDSCVFPGADPVLPPGMPPVGGVDIGGIGPPAPQGDGQVRHPQAVTEAVLGLEQGQLGTRVRPLAAGQNPPRLSPTPPVVPPRALPPPPRPVPRRAPPRPPTRPGGRR